jgi:hypothetical protein
MSTCRSVHLIGLATLLLMPSLAAANPIKSRNTTINLKSCKVVARYQDGGAWNCAGISGYPVYIAEGDLREYLAFGRNARKHRAANQTLPPFNTIFDSKTNLGTIEWRLETRNGRDVPFATIVRYSTKNDEGSGQVLIVSKVADGQSCQVAHVDALANPDALKLARDVADKEARTFDCKQDPKTVGKTGKSPM